MTKKYASYKSSGVDWIGDIPEHWKVKKLKFLSKINLSNVDKKTIGGQDKIKLCNYTDVYYNDKITSDIKFMEASATKEQIDKFLLQKNDVIITKDSESPDDIAVPAYILENFDNVICGYHLAHIKPKSITGLFLYYSFLTEGIKDQFSISANGITRYGIGKDAIQCSLFVVPPETEQQKIASYLDKKSAEIDQFIKNKEALINLLEEEKKAIITKAVTKGLDKNVKFKDSGVDWLGKIPEHWEVRKAKFIFKREQRKISKNDEIVTAFRDGQVTLRLNRRIEGFTNALKEIGYQGVRKHDLVIHGMDAFAGAVGVSDSDGKCSPVYSICTPISNEEVYIQYFGILIRVMALSDYILSLAKGIRERSTDFRYSEFSVLYLPIPNIKEQQEIVTFLNEQTKKIENLKAKYRQEIDLIKEYKERLIYDVVTGKMNVLEY